MRNLPAERLGIAIHAVAQARRALELTTAYAQDRKAFGQPIGTFQVNRHAIADMSVLIDVMQVYVDRCITAVNAGELTAEQAAGAKLWATEQQWQIIDRCLQLHGGYGYINEYEIVRLWPHRFPDASCLPPATAAASGAGLGGEVDSGSSDG